MKNLLKKRQKSFTPILYAYPGLVNVQCELRQYRYVLTSHDYESICATILSTIETNM